MKSLENLVNSFSSVSWLRTLIVSLLWHIPIHIINGVFSYFLEILEDIQSHLRGKFLHIFWIKGYPLKDKNFNYKTSADLVSKLQFFCSKSRLPKNCCRTSRDKNILEQIPRPRFFRVLKFPAIFSICLARRKEREISKPGKNRGLESSSNIFFPLAFPFTETSHSRNFIGNTYLRWRSLISFGLDSVLISFWRLVFPMCTP